MDSSSRSNLRWVFLLFTTCSTKCRREAGGMRSITLSVLLLLFLLPFSSMASSEAGPYSGDAEALLALKSVVDAHGRLPWRRGSSGELCDGWLGVKQCTPDGRVTKLVVEFLNLTGILTAELVAPLDQLRVLSFKSNSLSGAIPDLNVLPNLKSLYLSDNHFSGRIPASLAAIHRLKVIVLSDNRLSGPIPASLASLPRLYSFQLQSNRLTGRIPALNQPSLRHFNVSNNNLSGEIPVTLLHFNASSFLNMPRICGAQIGRPCSSIPLFPPSLGPGPPQSSSAIMASPPILESSHRKHNWKRVVAIVASSAAGLLFLLICLGLLVVLASRKRKAGSRKSSNRVGERGDEGVTSVSRGVSAAAAVAAAAGGGGRGKPGFSWEGEGLGKLVFVGGVGEMYSLEDLLKASAETLGRGTVGSTYKAVMESGFILTVKRLREPAAGPTSPEGFQRQMEELGRLRHPNLVPLRAYFQAKEERLLVFDYFPNGSLFSLIHGSRPSGTGKPLHWTSCLKIAEDVAAGLLYLHQQSSGDLAAVVHGNLKSSNVLLGPDFESCLTDYALLPSPDTTAADDPAAASTSSLFYRAPECRPPRHSPFSPRSDVYSFGVLLLELLTGKTPSHDLVDQRGDVISNWVRSVRDDEKEKEAPASSAAGSSTSGGGSDAAVEEKLSALLAISTACVAAVPEARPDTKKVLRMIREARAEGATSVSSSSSAAAATATADGNDGHSPGRWPDAVLSLPREFGSERLIFAERD
ncbi:Inactive leucine-rich repeat receptor-like serine/threonine-protein kinase [Apostasia shenzhenica]|uniref:Inactive leucine-rich repeat receptor-like serine/threonine-protein kinase n=1 Tax=Apostasia shenzhenica TaxID=1088818 RepID=A0A2H9ZYU2_9ASPA|nr:Inactive leucine-rich repeat receptor-like serine/threonine-protein kinase [Apostasia shenzhenica]